MPRTSLRIVVADDEPDMRDYFADLLPDLGHELLAVAKTGQELVEKCRMYHPDLIITDVKMPDGDGLSAIAELNQERFTPSVVVTAFHDAETLARAKDAQVFAYLVKPFERPQLESAIEIAWTRFTEFQSVRDEANSLRQALEDRKQIERAKGLLMKQSKLNEDEAFRRLQKMARDRQKKLSEIAELVIAAAEAFFDQPDSGPGFARRQRINTMKIAGVQFDMQLANVDDNLRRMIDFVQQTSTSGAKLTVFPECALTGYCFESIDEARPFAQSIPGPATKAVSEVCAQRDSFVVFGMLELAGGNLFNSAVLVGPDGVVDSYRKVHLPYLGIDKYSTHGDRPFAVHSANDLRVGMNICYDASFPEAARTLTLQGADLIALPTNWPPGADCVAETTIRCRALENGVYFIAVNRIGIERDFRFIGQSQICDPGGRLLHLASADSEEVFYAEIDPALARRKHVIRVPGEHEIHRIADRRPEMYGSLVRPHNLKSPGRR